MLQAGTHRLPDPLGGYQVKVTAAEGALLATVTEAESGRPLVSFGVAGDERTSKSLWPMVVRLYLNVMDTPGFRAADAEAPPLHPPPTPWCAAAVILPTPGEALWVADFERVMAWAWLEKQKDKA